jgi:hypothetical protein
MSDLTPEPIESPVPGGSSKPNHDRNGALPYNGEEQSVDATVPAPIVTAGQPAGWAPEVLLPASPRFGSQLAKLTIGLVALAVVIALSVVAIFLFKGGDASSNASKDVPSATTAPTAPAQPTADPDPTVIASAGDVGAVSIITSDVTCRGFESVENTLTAAQSNGWNQRDGSVAGSAWSADQRTQFEAVGKAMRDTADVAVRLARQTPHRVMRELYEAYVAYGRAYADSLANYQPVDDYLARTTISAMSAISEICTSAYNGAAGAMAADLTAAAPPAEPPIVGDPANPQRFLPQAGPTCGRWVPAEAALQTATEVWAAIRADANASEWTPDQQAAQVAMGPLLTTAADTVEAAGRGSGLSEFDDFATLAALYYRAYAAAIPDPNYSPADRDLALAGLRLDSLVSSACQAAAGS